MTRTGSELFIELAATERDDWLRGAVVAGSGTAVTVQLYSPGDLDSSPFKPGDEITIHAVRGQALATQTARVLAVSITTPGEFTFEPIGEPVESDRRRSRRTHVAGTGLIADFEDEIGCEIVDMNDDGMSLVADHGHVAGAIGALNVHFAGEMIAGYGAIRSVRPYRDGKMLYGIQVLEMAGTLLHLEMARIHATLLRESVGH